MEAVREVALVLEKAGRFLLLRRPANGSFAGMWETPRVRVGDHESPQDAARRAARELAGLECAAAPREVMAIKHTVMRTRIELTVFRAGAMERAVSHPLHEAARWAKAEEWLELPTSTTQRRIARVLAG